MCGDLRAPPSLMATGYPESRCVEQKLARLQEQNARLVQQQREQEQCLRELQHELAQYREEDHAKRVARFAQEKASCVLRHEEQIQKLREHYEQKLATLNPAGQVRQTEIDRLRTALVDEQNRTAQAETQLETADASVNRHKRKLQKLQQHHGDQIQNIRKRFRRWISGATKHAALDHGRLAFSIWRVAAERRSSNRDTFKMEAERWAITALTQSPWQCCPSILAIIAARPMLSALAAFRAWAAVVSAANYEISLQDQLETVRTQCATGSASAQHELKCAIAAQWTEKQKVLALTSSLSAWISIVRTRKQKCGFLAGNDNGIAVLAVALAEDQICMYRAIHEWALVAREVKHATRVDGSLDDASRLSATPCMEMQSLRNQRYKIAANVIESRALACLSAPFGAWAREVLQSQLRKRGRGDVVLNSGEAAKRAMKTLEDVRAQHEQELTACKNEVSEYCMVATTASRAKNRAYTLSERLNRFLSKEFKEITLQTVLRAWREHILNEIRSEARKTRHSERRSSAALEILTRATDAERIISVALVLWRRETLAMLHEKALAKSLADASKKSDVAIACVHRESRKALQNAWTSSSEMSRRNAAFERRQVSETDASLQRSIRELLSEKSRPVSRPTTARDMEEHLECLEKQARDRAVIPSGSTTPSTVASTALVGTEGSYLIRSSHREDRRCLISDLLNFRGGELQSPDMKSLALMLQSWRCQTAESLRERWVQAAREGRKGLFVAALNQQARYWMSDGFVAWTRAVLEARCERLQAAGQVADTETSPKAQTSCRKGKCASTPNQELGIGSSRSRRVSQ